MNKCKICGKSIWFFQKKVTDSKSGNLVHNKCLDNLELEKVIAEEKIKEEDLIGEVEEITPEREEEFKRIQEEKEKRLDGSEYNFDDEITAYSEEEVHRLQAEREKEEEEK